MSNTTKENRPTSASEAGSVYYHYLEKTLHDPNATHRTNGPGFVYCDGSFGYSQRGHWHREDGPSYYDPSAGIAGYWIYDDQLSEDQFKKYTANKIKNLV